ncbi:hypothetical protein QTP88_007223 [Uroleucon formosanum]
MAILRILVYLSTGMSFRALALCFKMYNTTVGAIIYEGTSIEIPFFMLGDNANLLKHNIIIKPFSKRLISKEERFYNYRHARARRCVKNAFGIMVSKWRLLHKPIETTVDNAIKIVQCICLLHNLIIDKEGQPCAQTLISAASSYKNDRNEKNVRTNAIRPFNRSSNLATFIRDTLKIYFISPIESISFQEQYAKVQNLNNALPVVPRFLVIRVHIKIFSSLLWYVSCFWFQIWFSANTKFIKMTSLTKQLSSVTYLQLLKYLRIINHNISFIDQQISKSRASTNT